MAAHMKKTEWDNIPEWAIYALEYGTEEDGSLNEEERAMIEKFVGTHFPKGYTMSVDWNACNEFDRYPAFGEGVSKYPLDNRRSLYSRTFL